MEKVCPLRCKLLPRMGVPTKFDDEDAHSELSMHTQSTVDSPPPESSTSACSTVASSVPTAEEKEIQRLEKKLRDIAKLEDRLATGGRLDALQIRKIQQRQEVQVYLDAAKGLAAARLRGQAK